jgi:hypothetical protein
MNIRSVLCVGAAMLATGSAVQAADLGAEPVDYVKICDAFGSGYYYAPGTDTCIRINGYVRVNLNLNRTPSAGTYPNASHFFDTRGTLNVYARSMTEYGTLGGWIQLEGNVGGTGASIGNSIVVQGATASLGPLVVGYDYSIFAARPLVDTFTTDEGNAFNGRDRTQFVSLNWALADGAALGIAAEDYRGRDGAANLSTGQIPDLIANLMVRSGPIQFQAGFGYGDRIMATSWGANAVMRVALDQIAKGDAFVIGAVYANGDDGWIDGGASQTFGSAYSVYASFLHNWSSQFGTAVSALYRSDLTAVVTTNTLLAAQLRFTPVRNFTVTGEVQAVGVDFANNDIRGLFRFQRNYP